MKKILGSFFALFVVVSVIVYFFSVQKEPAKRNLATEAAIKLESISKADVKHSPEVQEAKPAKKESATLVGVMDLILQNPSYAKFTEALRVTGLSTLLKDEKHLTIFVPTDQMINKEPAAIRSLFDQPQNTNALKEVLMSHIVQGYVLSDNLLNRTIKTMNGKKLEVSTSGKTEADAEQKGDISFSAELAGDASLRSVLFYDPVSQPKKRATFLVNGVKITKADIKGSNGIIYEVDGVIPSK